MSRWPFLLDPCSDLAQTLACVHRIRQPRPIKNYSQNTCTKYMLIKPPINDHTSTTGKSLMGAEGRACSLALDVVYLLG